MPNCQIVGGRISVVGINREHTVVSLKHAITNTSEDGTWLRGRYLARFTIGVGLDGESMVAVGGCSLLIARGRRHQSLVILFSTKLKVCLDREYNIDGSAVVELVVPVAHLLTRDLPIVSTNHRRGRG